MISGAAISKLVTRLSFLKYFPGSEDGRHILAEAVEAFASTDEQIDWLGTRMLALFTEWPGLREMRAVFCARFKPKDGLDIESATFPEGMPSEYPQIAPAPVALLPPGHVATCDVEFDQAIQYLAQSFSIPDEEPKPREDPPCVPEPPRAETCRKCGGPGVLADGAFCDCAMGRDLAKVMHRRPEIFRCNGNGTHP